MLIFLRIYLILITDQPAGMQARESYITLPVPEPSNPLFVSSEQEYMVGGEMEEYLFLILFP